ncbi:protein Hook 3-like X2 [Biomphalaria glabrata]
MMVKVSTSLGASTQFFFPYAVHIHWVALETRVLKQNVGLHLSGMIVTFYIDLIELLGIGIRSLGLMK